MAKKADATTKPATTTKLGIPAVAYSALMAVLGGLFFMGAVYFAAQAADVLRGKLFFHALVFGAFFGLYSVMPGGFESNFNLPEKKGKMSIADVAYYTMVVHSTAGFGDIYPTSFYARSCVATHLGLVFLATTGILSALG